MEEMLSTRVRFGHFELDLKSGELRKGSRPLFLQEQPLRVLQMIVERGGELATRQEIQKKLWPNDTVVDFDHGINTAINKIRQALGDSADNPKYIQTVARRGYRLLVPVEWVDAGAPGQLDPKEIDDQSVKASPSTGNLTGKKVSHYRVLEILGGGGMGLVYKAEDLKLGRTVAMKFLPEELGDDPKAKERFEREARAASALDHPNICSIYEFGEYEGQPFIVMQFLAGQNLRDLLADSRNDRGYAFRVDELLDLAIQIVSGLGAAHEKGIIHRDIKPANIFITNRGQAKVLDFGVAKMLDVGESVESADANSSASGGPPGETPASWSVHLTRTGVALGTEGYMSPEQIRAESLDARTDLFSVGLVLYEMAAGQRAFTGNTAAELHEAILHQAPVPPRELNPAIPPEVEAIIRRCLEKERERRYQSAEELIGALEGLRDAPNARTNQPANDGIGTGAVSSPPQVSGDGFVAARASDPITEPPVESASATKPTRPEEKPRSHPKRTLAIFAASCACVLLVGAGWFLYTKLRANNPPPVQRALTRLTSDDGLQTGATWSPDGRFIAYASDRGGKFDIWVQQVSGGDPVQVTKGPGQNWQPDWSPDGKCIAYRSEEGDGGIYITPALGGAGLQRRVTSYGYFPHWSPDGSRILFQTSLNRIYIVALDGSPAREVLTGTENNQDIVFAVWHPDGKRITAWILDPDNPIPNFSTAPVDGGPAVKSKFPPELQKQIEAVAPASNIAELRWDFRFAWAPSGTAIFFERTFRGARNVWRMTVDPVTLQPTQVERLTTSPGLDADLAVSPDGSKLAFTSERQQIRAWSFPFDANHGRVTGPGQPVTSAGIEAWALTLSRDGKKLGIWGRRDGQVGTWEKSIPNGHEEPLMAGDSYVRDPPIWSPDGKLAAYMRGRSAWDKSEVVVWSSENHNEEAIAADCSFVYDWSADGKSVLASCWAGRHRAEIWQLFIDPSLSRESSVRKIIADPNYDLWQPHVSPDDRWVVFEGTRNLLHRVDSTIYVMPAAGGPWIQISDGKQWDDKPRWSLDGKTIYFLSDHRGFFNLWGVHFDPVKGRPQGEPFQVTSFETPALMIPRHISPLQFSFADGRLMLPLAQASGNIWILDNVDR